MADERILETAVLAAARAGDHAAFAALAERYRRQLRAHCYRMLGSFDDAEDAVQETLLRAWRAREGFEGRSLFRTWLYRIATNTCLNVLERTPRRALPEDVAPPVRSDTPESEARATPPSAEREIAWLQPFPDALLDRADDATPDAILASRESIALAYLVALQSLPPRQRAALLLADVVGLSVAEVAELMETTQAAAASAVQRAHATLRARRSAGRDERAETEPTDDASREALRIFMEAWESGDVTRLMAILREDARWSMPPAPLWFDGRAAIERLLALFPPRWRGRELRMVAVGANRQPAAAAYVRMPGDTAARLAGVHVLRVVGGDIAEIFTFGPELCAGFALPDRLP